MSGLLLLERRQVPFLYIMYIIPGYYWSTYVLIGKVSPRKSRKTKKNRREMDREVPAPGFSASVATQEARAPYILIFQNILHLPESTLHSIRLVSLRSGALCHPHNVYLLLPHVIPIRQSLDKCFVTQTLRIPISSNFKQFNLQIHGSLQKNTYFMRPILKLALKNGF